jgi:hypothetical protein
VYLWTREGQEETLSKDAQFPGKSAWSDQSRSLPNEEISPLSLEKESQQAGAVKSMPEKK